MAAIRQIGGAICADPRADLFIWGADRCVAAILFVVPIEAIGNLVTAVVPQQTLAGTALEFVIEALFGLTITNRHFIAPVFAIALEVARPVGRDTAAVGAPEGAVITDELGGDTPTAAIVGEGLVYGLTLGSQVQPLAGGGILTDVGHARVIEVLAVQFTLTLGDRTPLGHFDAFVGVLAKAGTYLFEGWTHGPTVQFVFATSAIEVLVTEVLFIDADAILTTELVFLTFENALSDTATAAVIVEPLCRRVTVEVQCPTLACVLTDVADARQIRIEAIHGLAVAFDGRAADGRRRHVVAAAHLETVDTFLRTPRSAVGFVAFVAAPAIEGVIAAVSPRNTGPVRALELMVSAGVAVVFVTRVRTVGFAVTFPVLVDTLTISAGDFTVWTPITLTDRCCAALGDFHRQPVTGQGADFAVCRAFVDALTIGESTLFGEVRIFAVTHAETDHLRARALGLTITVGAVAFCG